MTKSVALSLSCKQPWVFLLASKRMCQTGNINPLVDVPGLFFTLFHDSEIVCVADISDLGQCFDVRLSVQAC